MSTRIVTLVRTRTVVTTELHEVEVRDGEQPPAFPQDGSVPAVVLPVSDSMTGGQAFPGTAVQYLRALVVPRPHVPIGSTSEQWKAATQAWLESLP